MDATRSPASISYDAAHDAVRKAYGRADQYLCIGCGNHARNWAYDHGDPDPRYAVEHGLQFSLDVARYQPLCLSCHRVFDTRPVAERYAHPRQRAEVIPEVAYAADLRARARARLDDLLLTHLRVVMTPEWRITHPGDETAVRLPAA